MELRIKKTFKLILSNANLVISFFKYDKKCNSESRQATMKRDSKESYVRETMVFTKKKIPEFEN